MKRAYKILSQIFVVVVVLVALDCIIDRVMLHGVNRYYGFDQKSNILLIGHSHLMLATDKAKLERGTGLKVSKYCREGVNVSDRKVMVDHFLADTNIDSLKYVLYGVDLATFTGDGLSMNSYKLMYPFMGNDSIDKYIKGQASGSDYWLHKLVKSSRYNDDGLKNSAIRGWMSNWDNMKFNTIDINAYKRQIANGKERHLKMNPELMKQFDSTIKELSERGLTVILVNTPTLDLANNFDAENYDKIMNWFHNYADSHDNVYFWDYNPKYSSDYGIFSDRIHLNRKGQEIITDELIKGIRELEEQNRNTRKLKNSVK